MSVSGSNIAINVNELFGVISLFGLLRLIFFPLKKYVSIPMFISFIDRVPFFHTFSNKKGWQSCSTCQHQNCYQSVQNLFLILFTGDSCMVCIACAPPPSSYMEGGNTNSMKKMSLFTFCSLLLSPKVSNSVRSTQVTQVTFMLFDLLVKLPHRSLPIIPCASLTFKPSNTLTT